MKATRKTIARAVDQPNADVRFYLFYGRDDAQARSLGARLVEALGAAKSSISSAAIKADPAALADEAGAMSLFGGKRVVWIEPATKDIEAAVAALLEGPDVESPVVAIGGQLTKTSPLLKMAEVSPLAVAYAAYPPEGDDAARMVMDIGRRVGLRIAPPVAARIADGCGNDEAIVSRELEKLALYVDASTVAPKELDHSAIDEVGAENAEGNFLALADLALSGNITELSAELARLPAGGNEGIPIVRSLQRRLLMLAPARARVERGESVGAVMTSLGKSLFFKDKAKVEDMLRKWSAGNLAMLSQRTGELERSLMLTDAPERESLGEELLAIARKARSL